MNKILFLDLDGVLVNAKSVAMHSGLHAQADPDCVSALNKITDTTHAKIVVSSTWRLSLSDRELAYLLQSWNVTGTMIGSTPVIYKTTKQRDLMVYPSRSNEIGSWLKNHRWDDFVILDDDGADIAFKSRLVQTKFEIGLTEELADQAIGILNSDKSNL